MRTTVVGSYPARPYRKDLMKQYFEGADPYLKTIEESVKSQIKAGIDIISDGQTRDNMINIFTRKLAGIRVAEKPIIIGEINFIEPITLNDQIYAKKFLKEGSEIKGIITGPYTLAKSCTNEYYKSEKDIVLAFTKALRQEAKSLESMVSVIQIDEPFFSVEFPDYAKEIVEIIAKDLGIPVALHVCGDISKIFKHLIEIDVDILDHEFKGNPGLLKVVGDYDFKQKLGYGSIKSDDERVETVNEIVKHIKKGVDIFGMEKLLIDPDCGLRDLSQDVAYRKLVNMVKARNEVEKER